MYGGDLRGSLAMSDRSGHHSSYTGAYLTLQQAMQRVKPWEYGTFIQESTHTPADFVRELKDIIQR